MLDFDPKIRINVAELPLRSHRVDEAELSEIFGGFMGLAGIIGQVAFGQPTKAAGGKPAEYDVLQAKSAMQKSEQQRTNAFSNDMSQTMRTIQQKLAEMFQEQQKATSAASRI